MGTRRLDVMDPDVPDSAPAAACGHRGRGQLRVDWQLGWHAKRKTASVEEATREKRMIIPPRHWSRLLTRLPAITLQVFTLWRGTRQGGFPLPNSTLFPASLGCATALHRWYWLPVRRLLQYRAAAFSRKERAGSCGGAPNESGRTVC